MAPNKFNRAMDLKLIAMVKQNPVLYDSSHEKYLDVDTREETWHTIGDTLDRPALEFAAIQCQIHFGDYNEEKHKPGLIENLSEYLPPGYLSRSAERKILKLFSKYSGLTPLGAKHLYIKTARALPTYGVTFFLVKEIQKGKKKMVPRLLGINSESILRLDENTKEILQVWPLSHVKSYHVGSNDIFSLNFGDYSDQEYSVKTNDALRIRDILEGYIDIIRKRLCGPYSTHHADSGAISQEEVRPDRGNVITHVFNTPSKVVEQTYVGPSKILPFEQGSQAAVGTEVMTMQQLIVTYKGSTTQEVLSGEVPLRSDMTLNVVNKLNHMNSNAVRVVTMLGEITEQNAKEIRNIIASMEQDMPAIQSGIKETAEKQTSEEARRRVLSELKQLEDLLQKLGNSANKDLMSNDEALEQARQIADLTTKMYFSLDPRTKRGSQLLRQSRQSFIADERLEGTLRRASFIAAAGGVDHTVDTARGILQQPYQGAVLSFRELELLEAASVDKLGKLNAAVALFLVSHADPQNPDYATAVNSMNTIKELLPELATDAQSISHAKGAETGQELLDEVTALCDAARRIGMLTGCDDRDKIQEASTMFADVSGKLVYILGSRNRRVNADKENEIVELAKQVGDMTTVLLVKASELTCVAQQDSRAEAVDSAGVLCADAARDLLACAQLTAPTIREAHCQSALTAAAEALTSAERNLTRTWEPLVGGKERQTIGNELATCNLELDRAVDRLKSAYAGLEDMQVEENELSPEQIRKLRFISGVNTARGTLQHAMDDINKPLPHATLTEAQVNQLHDSISHKMALTNACVAALLQAKSDAGNPDYSTADDAVTTIAELTPQVIEETRRLISGSADERGRVAMLNDIQAWCRAVDRICAASSAASHVQELEETAKNFAQASRKMSFVFSPRARKAREQLMMELFTSAHKQAMDMVDDTNKMAATAGGANGVKLRDLGSAVHNSAKALQNTVMVTAPTIEENRCRSLVISRSESLQGAAERLVGEVVTIKDDETGCRVLSAQLQEHRVHITNHANDLNKTLAAVKQTLDDTTQDTVLESKAAMGNSSKSNRQKTENDHKKAEKDQLKPKRGHQITEKDNQKAENDRDKAEKERQKSEKDLQKADKDHQISEKDRQKSENHHQKSEKDRQKSENHHQKSEKDRQKSENDHQKAEKDRQNKEKFAKTVDIAEQRFIAAEKDMAKLMSANSVGPAVRVGIEQEEVLRKEVEHKLGMAALAAASLLGHSPSDATDHIIATQAVDNLSQIIPDLVKDTTLLSNSLDNKERKRLLDSIKSLCEATRRLVRSSKDNTQELNESAIEFGDEMARLLYLVCAEVDPTQEKEVIERARAIADSVSRLATSGAELAQASPALAHRLCDKGRSAAEAARTFVYTAKLVAPAIQHQQCQQSLITTSKQLSTTLKEYSECLEQIPTNDKNLETIAKMTSEECHHPQISSTLKEYSSSLKQIPLNDKNLETISKMTSEEFDHPQMSSTLKDNAKCLKHIPLNDKNLETIAKMTSETIDLQKLLDDFIQDLFGGRLVKRRCVEKITVEDTPLGQLATRIKELAQEPTATVKSFVQIQEETSRKWLQRRPSNSEVSTAGHQSVTTLIDIAHHMCEDMEEQEREEMQNVIRESRKLLAQCAKKYDNDVASALWECVRELRRAIEKCTVSRVVDGFLHTEEPLQEFEVLLDAEKDATKRKFLLEQKIAELMSHLGRVKRVAGIVARTGHAGNGRQLEDTAKQTELLAPLLVKAAQERVASPNDKEAVNNYNTLLAQYSEAISKVRNLCDTAVDPLHFVQTAGETMARMREESARRNDPQLCAYTSKAINRLANRVIVVGMSSEVARADPALRGALADAQGKLTAVTVNGEAHATKLADWTDNTEKILKTTAEVESALGGENIFKKLPEPDQPIYNAALSLHSAVRGWSARDNEIVAVAKRMAVLMARLSEQMNEARQKPVVTKKPWHDDSRSEAIDKEAEDRKRELLVTSKSIVLESREVAATARRLAHECPDLRIRNNLLQVCERIPTISGQLKMLTTVKSSALGLQGGEEDREAMNMLVTNAQNLMSSVQEVVKAAASASVKIASSRGLKWVRRNY